MTKPAPIQITVTVSEPYRVVGYQGGRYGASQFAKRDYKAEVLGQKFQNTSKAEIQSAIRFALHRNAFATGAKVGRVIFTFVPETAMGA
jgi:hypothetical protein